MASSKKRVYTEEDKREFKGMHETDVVKTILLKDKRPVLYFGTKSIESISMDWNEEGFFDILLTIRDYAASIIIKTLLKILKSCERNSSRVQRLANMIRVRIKEADGNEFDIYPKNPELLGYQGVAYAEIEIEADIIDLTGKTKITVLKTIVNEDQPTGIRINRLRVLSNLPTANENVKSHAFEVIDDEQNQLKMERKDPYRDKEGREKGYAWVVYFPRTLEMNRSIKLRIELDWKGFCDLNK